MKTNSSTPITLAQAKELLKAREKEGELGYEQKLALAHAEKFAKQDAKEAEKLVKKIMENKKITLEMAIMFVNIAPKYSETVKTISGKIELANEEVEEILKLFK